MIISEENPEQFVSPDGHILAAIWDTLGKIDAVRSLDMGSLSIDVKAGEVYLYGHLALENNLPLIEKIAQSIEGIVAVHNHLVTDDELMVQVAQALAGDKDTRYFLIPVNAMHGWIQLGGVVPTREIQYVAEKVAGRVSSVRGVITLPRLAGESPIKPRRFLQPRIGAAVYGGTGESGIVSQVIIQPDNRLVTHVVVRFKELRGSNLLALETVVPLRAIELMNKESIFLARNSLSFKDYPVLDPGDYPLALFTWRPPYPYTAGKVRWSFQEILEAQTHKAPDQVIAQAGMRADSAR